MECTLLMAYDDGLSSLSTVFLIITEGILACDWQDVDRLLT